MTFRALLRSQSHKLWDAIASLKLTLVCLALLMVLVVACTLAQVELGTLGAVKAYIRSPFVYWRVPNSAWSVPVFPGGGLVGLVLLVNLIAAQARRLQLSLKKSGLWLVHAGLILLFVGEFVTSAFQVEMQLPIEVGQTASFVESPRDQELAITDVTDPARDETYGVPEGLLAREGVVPLPGTPLTVRVQRFFPGRSIRTGMSPSRLRRLRFL